MIGARLATMSSVTGTPPWGAIPTGGSSSPCLRGALLFALGELPWQVLGEFLLRRLGLQLARGVGGEALEECHALDEFRHALKAQQHEADGQQHVHRPADQAARV